VSTAAASVLDPHELARVALDETLRILSAERAVLFLADDDGTLRPSLGRDAAARDLVELSAYSSTLVDRAATERASLVVTGSEEGAALGSESAVVYGLRSIMVAPLELDDRLIGVVYLDSRVAKGVFTEADIEILTAVTSHIAVSLETARAAQLEIAVQSAREQRDTAELLRFSIQELTATLDPGEVLARVTAVMARAVPADRVCLIHRDADLIVSSPDGIDLHGVDVEALLALEEACQGDGTATMPPGVGDLLGDVRGWLASPLAAHGHGRGVLLAASTTSAFTGTHLDIASALTSEAAIAYAHARLFAQVQQMAVTDVLTGVHNRRRFTELASQYLSVAVRNGRPLAVMMLDIDHFKKVNDTYGHSSGDDVIRAVAEALQSQIRGSDLLGRYGGEEFVVLLSELHTDPWEVAERLRTTVADASVANPVGPIRVTISIGVAQLKPDDDLVRLITRADEALYRAKDNGRNQVAHG
jgi:diguanylate cyclase (GGDEF)-like protein